MEHPRIIAACAIALATTLFAIFSMRPWARRVGLVDKPDLRKQHSGRVPVIGGICFFVGTLVGLGYLGFIDRFVMSLMMGSALIVAVGVADDVVDLSVRSRLMIESAIVGLIILSTGYYIDHVGGLLPAGHNGIGLLGIPLTLFAVIGLINAFNMLDGIDGLAASVAMLCIGSVLMFDRAGWVSVGVMFMLQILFAALIPYIFANLGWPDGRKIFMGDAGSTAIGFLLGWSLIYLSHSRVGRLAPVDVLWCVAVPIMDTLAVMYRRVRLGRSPFGADRQHVHHLLLDAGFSPRATLALIVGGGAALALLGYALRSVPDVVNLLAFIAVTILYLLGLPRLLEARARGIAWRPGRGRGFGGLGQRLGWLPPRSSALQDEHPSDEDHEPYPLPQAGMRTPLRALCVVAGTPESIGMAPIARRLASDERFRASICLSEVAGVDGQAALRMFGLQADHRLEGEDGAEAMANHVRDLFDAVKPDVVLVPGNTPASFALSLAAHAEAVPLVCVGTDGPASMPSHWPNEASRRIVQSLAALHVATSAGTGQRLREEGVPPERVLVHDGAAADALRAGLHSLRDGAGGDAPALAATMTEFPFLRTGSPLLLVLDALQPGDAAALAEALAMIARRRPDIDIIWPAGPRTGTAAGDTLRAFANVHALDVVDYLSWVRLLECAHLVLAGQGAECEGRLLGKPVLVARDGPESGIDGGVVIGTTAVAIAGRVLTLLSEPDAYRTLCEGLRASAADHRLDGHAVEKHRLENGQPLLDALARLCGNDDVIEERADSRYAYRVQQEAS